MTARTSLPTALVAHDSIVAVDRSPPREMDRRSPQVRPNCLTVTVADTVFQPLRAIIAWNLPRCRRSKDVYRRGIRTPLAG
jgi:hypothetical protein